MLHTVQIFFTLCDQDSGGSKMHIARKMKDKLNVVGRAAKFLTKLIHIYEK
jgi:hypothetical protein